MDIAPKVPVRTTTQLFKLEQANEALIQLRSGKLQGAAVLMCDEFARTKTRRLKPAPLA
jgi:propanol-preferring alcohol dehydrogenase